MTIQKQKLIRNDCFVPRRMRRPGPGAVILGDEGGVGVSKILHRKIGEGIYLNSGGKGCHDRRAEAVDEPLNEKDAEIHDGLLQAGEEGKIPELF